MIYEFFDRTFSGAGVKSEITSNWQLAEEIHNPVIWKLEKCKANSSSIDNIWSADLMDKQLRSKFHKKFPFTLYVIDICSRYAWFVSLKEKKGITIINAF